MGIVKHQRSRRGVTAAAVLGLLLASAGLTLAGAVPAVLLRSFAFPVSFANGLVGDLIVPIGTTSKLSFESGKIAIGELPMPLPERSGSRRRARAPRRFMGPPDSGPHVRLLLNGVIDADGSLVMNTGNQLVIDAAVSTGSAASSAPPFVFPFDINGGLAFVDVPLPVQAKSDGSVRIQIIGVSVLDPEGQPFAALGFEVTAARPTPVASLTPLPSPTPQPEGQCFQGATCTGESFAATQDDCCRSLGRPASVIAAITSWCPTDAFDATTGQCATGACVACGPIPPPSDCGDRPSCKGPCAVVCADGSLQSGFCQTDGSCHCSAACSPTPTPTPGPCANLSACGGSCTLTCSDGTTVAGQCTSDPSGACQCSAMCSVPTPCGIGECFDTISMSCTGQPCDSALRCPLPNQFCDVGGRHCPCQAPPPLPHGHICCQCKNQVPACFDFSFVEVQPICPPGCESFFGQECDQATQTCVPLPPCSSDADCNDGNGCTIDRCTPSGCTHDCVCVGPAACGPGPGLRRGPH